MARPRSRFGSAARKRRRVPSRAERRARSPREPSAAVLAYRIAMRQVAGKFAKAVKARVWGSLDEYALRQERRADASEDGSGGVPKSVLSIIDERTLGRATDRVADKTVRHSVSEFKRLGIRLRDGEPKLDKLIRLWRKENVAKIKSLFGDELVRINDLLAASEGRTVKQLTDRIEERFAVTRSKAELLARDQTITLNARVNQERQKAAGIESYIWTTAGDERVRDLHADLDGQRFRYDDPPESGVSGERQNPGEPINCRCQAYPVLPELED